MSSAISSKGADTPAPRGGAALLLGAGLCGFDAGMVGYVLPAMRAETGADPLLASWIVTLYIVGTLAAIPLAGVLVRRWGGAMVFRACAAVAVAGAAAAFFARDPVTLVAARLVQGIGMGPLLPVAAATVAVGWPAARQGRFMGFISLAYGVCYLGATGVAPWLLGFGWRMVFAASAGIALAALLLARETGTGRLELGRASLQPMQASREMTAIAALALGTGIGQAVVIFFPTLAVQRLGVAPGEAALLMLPLVVAGVATTVGIMARLDRVGARTLLAAGAVLTLAGTVLAAFPPASRPLFLLAAGVLGVGITLLCGGPLRYAAGKAAPAAEQGPAQGAVALLTNVGVLGGSVILGAVGASGLDEQAALQLALGVVSALMLATFVPVVRLRR